MSMMPRFVWLTLLVIPFASGQTIYTWQDSHGVRHFSDVASGSNAQALHLQSPSIAAKPLPNNSDDANLPLTLEPLSIHIASPLHDQAIRTNSGDLTVHAQLNRKLISGEQLQLIVDSAPQHAPNRDAQWQLHNLDRGSHTLIINAFKDGKLIASSQSIKVHILRATLNSVKPTPNR